MTQEVQTGVGEDASTEMQEEALSETDHIPNAEEGDSTVVEEGTATAGRKSGMLENANLTPGILQVLWYSVFGSSQGYFDLK